MSHATAKKRMFPLISHISKLSLFVLFMLSTELRYNVAIALLQKPPWLPPPKTARVIS